MFQLISHFEWHTDPTHGFLLRPPGMESGNDFKVHRDCEI